MERRTFVKVGKKYSKEMEKQDLPVVDILFEKIKAKDIPFNPVNFYKDYDSEKYFELLILWKGKNKKEHLTSRPQYKPYRHKKVLEKSKKDNKRIIFF